MVKNFIKDRKVIELQMDSKAKLLVYLDQEYDEYYFDSTVYFFDGKQEYELVNESFSFSIGKNLYTRVHCINEYTGRDFERELYNSGSLEFFESFGQFFEFLECVNYDMYLYKEKGKIIFLLNKLENSYSEEKNIVDIAHKKLYKAEIPEKFIDDWKVILEKEYIPMYVAELKKINKDISEHEIQKSLESLKVSK